MGFVEVQYRESEFLAAARTELNATDLALDTLEALLPGGGLIDHWECTAVSLVDSMPSGALDKGSIGLRADLAVFVTTAEGIESAPSGQPPPMQQLGVAAFVEVAGLVALGGQLRRTITAVQVNGVPVAVPAELSLSRITLPTPPDSDQEKDEESPTDIVSSFAATAPDVVVFRFGSRMAGKLDGPSFVNRLPTGEDWALMLSGTLLQEGITHSLNKGSVTERSDLEEPFTAHWFPFGLSAHGWTVVPDECEFANIDFSVEISAFATFSFDPETEAIIMRVTVSWNVSDADSFRCIFVVSIFGVVVIIVGIIVAFFALPVGAFIAGVGIGLILIPAIAIPMIVEQMAEIHGQAIEPTDAALEKVAETDDSVTFRGPMSVSLPDTSAMTTTTNGMLPVSADGLVVFGTMEVFSRSRTLKVTVFDPRYARGFSCDTMSWFQQFHAPQVVLTSSMPNFRLRDAPTASPPDTWQVVNPEALLAQDTGPYTITLAPVGALEVGSVAEVQVRTTAGMRRIVFAPVPAEPNPPTEAETILEHGKCKVDSMKELPDDWPPGKFNPHWHVDPPPERVRDPYRQWQIVYEGLAPNAVVEVTVVPDDAPHEAVTTAAARFHADAGGRLAEVIVTRADERIALNVLGRLREPMIPRMRQQWLVEVDSIDVPNVDGEIDEILSTGPRLLLRSGSTVDVIAPGVPTPQRVPSGHRLATSSRWRSPAVGDACDRPVLRPLPTGYYRQQWVVADGDRLAVCLPAGAVEQHGDRGPAAAVRGRLSRREGNEGDSPGIG